MSIKILYNGYVCIREYDRGISDIVDDFMGEFDAYYVDSLLVYVHETDTFYAYEGYGNYSLLPQELCPAAYELMGIKKGETK